MALLAGKNSQHFLTALSDLRPLSSMSDSGQDSGQGATPLITINATKAGMKDLDEEKINSIILEASKDTPFFKHQENRQKRIDQQIGCMLDKMNRLSPQDIIRSKLQVQKKQQELEMKQRDLSQIVVHVDMDMFYAAVETLDDASLAEKPMAVGSYSMLATSNYVARKFGVRAGMGQLLALTYLILIHIFV